MGYHHDRPVVGLKLPKGYTVQNILTINGRSYRAVRGQWCGTIRHSATLAAEDAWIHFNRRNFPESSGD